MFRKSCMKIAFNR